MFTSFQKPSSYPGFILLCPLQDSVVRLQPLDTSQAPVPGVGERVAFRTSVAGATVLLHFGGMTIVAAERRYNLISLILGVGGKERDRCLFLVAVGAVPARRMMSEWDLLVGHSGEQLSSLSGPSHGKIWPKIPSWGGSPCSPTRRPEFLFLSLPPALPGGSDNFRASSRLGMESRWSGNLQ